MELSKLYCAEISWFDLNGQRLFKVMEIEDNAPAILHHATDIAASYVRFFNAPRVVNGQGKLAIGEPDSITARAFVLAEVFTPQQMAWKLRELHDNRDVPHAQVLERLSHTLGLKYIEFAQSLEDAAKLCEAQPDTVRFVGSNRGFCKMEEGDIAFDRGLRMIWPIPPGQKRLLRPPGL